MALVNGVAIAVEVRRAPRQMRWGVEGVEGAGLASIEARTVFEGRCPCPLKVLQGKKVQGVGSTVVEASGKSAQSSADPPYTGNSGTVAGAG